MLIYLVKSFYFLILCHSERSEESIRILTSMLIIAYR